MPGAVRTVDGDRAQTHRFSSTCACVTPVLAVVVRELDEAERGFRDLKSTLDLRPLFHRIARIRAHVAAAAVGVFLVTAGVGMCLSGFECVAGGAVVAIGLVLQP
jgi:hypothetical protein